MHYSIKLHLNLKFFPCEISSVINLIFNKIMTNSTKVNYSLLLSNLLLSKKGFSELVNIIKLIHNFFKNLVYT